MRRFPALAVVAGLLTLNGCGTPPGENNDSPTAPQSPHPEVDPALTQLPTVEQPLSRRDLILASAEAASDSATRADARERQQRLDGRSFSFRIRLCQGAPGRGRLTFDPEDRVLRVSVSPDLTGADPLAAGLAGGRFEAVEGFWVPYPWLLNAACPAPPPVDASAETEQPETMTASPPLPTLGLAQFYPPDAERSARRGGRPFTLTRRLEEGSEAGMVDLVLQGRLTRLPDAEVINCRSADPSVQPRCIISVRFDAVRLEQASNGELLAEWSGG